MIISSTQIAVSYISFCAEGSSTKDFFSFLKQKIQFTHQINRHQNYRSNDRDGMAKLFKKYIYKNIVKINLYESTFKIKHNKIKIRLKFDEIVKQAAKEETVIYHSKQKTVIHFSKVPEGNCEINSIQSKVVKKPSPKKPHLLHEI